MLTSDSACTPLKGAGEPCTEAVECALGCKGGTCIAEAGTALEVNEAMCRAEPGALRFD